MNKLFCLVGCFLLSCTSCTETTTKPSVAPIIEVEPEEPPKEPKEKSVITWLHPEEARSLMENNCFVLKFYSTEAIENKILDELLSYDEVILKINSSYVPVFWDDEMSDRNQLGFGIDDDFAGLMIVPKEEDLSASLVEMDSATGNELPEDAPMLLTQLLNSMSCNKLLPGNVRYYQ